MNATRNLNIRAHDLNRRLFDLCYELSNLSLQAQCTIDFDAAHQFGAAVAAVKQAQQQLSECDLVLDASRDDKDQSFATPAAE